MSIYLSHNADLWPKNIDSYCYNTSSLSKNIYIFFLKKNSLAALRRNT